MAIKYYIGHPVVVTRSSRDNVHIYRTRGKQTSSCMMTLPLYMIIKVSNNQLHIIIGTCIITLSCDAY